MLGAVKRICIFCGSSVGAHPAYGEAARQLGTAAVQRGLGLVYGGGNIGLMSLLADAALARGGEVIGVIPQALVDKELAHRGVTQLHIVRSMHERKEMMADLADGFIALPGGYGTLEEFCEMLTWAQLGLHAKPCGLLNVSGFYDAFLAQVDQAVRARFLPVEHRSLILVESQPERLLARLLEFEPPTAHQWIGRDEA
jgi:hypothetical protein